MCFNRKGHRETFDTSKMKFSERPSVEANLVEDISCCAFLALLSNSLKLIFFFFAAVIAMDGIIHHEN